MYEDENNLYHYSYRKGDEQNPNAPIDTKNYAEDPWDKNPGGSPKKKGRQRSFRQDRGAGAGVRARRRLHRRRRERRDDQGEQDERSGQRPRGRAGADRQGRRQDADVDVGGLCLERQQRGVHQRFRHDQLLRPDRADRRERHGLFSSRRTATFSRTTTLSPARAP